MMQPADERPGLYCHTTELAELFEDDQGRLKSTPVGPTPSPCKSLACLRWEQLLRSAEDELWFLHAALRAIASCPETAREVALEAIKMHAEKYTPPTHPEHD